MNSALLILFCTVALVNAANTNGLPDANGPYAPPDPYVYDPVSGDLGDPTIVFNHQQGNAWVFYTQRPHWKIAGPGWYHGAPIGILSSGFGGYSWLYRGTAEGLAGAYEPGVNSFWAPEVVYDKGQYHMYVSYLRGVPLYGGPSPATYIKEYQDRKAGCILYFTSTDMIRWKFVRRLALEPDNGTTIDPCVHPLPDGTWRMWYRALEGGDKLGKKTFCNYADSTDLANWTNKGSAIDLDCYAEGEHVFHWEGYYWMLLDGMNPKKYGGNGLAVFRSSDAASWEYHGGILDDENYAKEKLAYWGGHGGHGSVMLQGDDAYLIYQAAARTGKWPCAGQVAKLIIKDGKLSAIRDFGRMKLECTKAPAFRGGHAPNFNPSKP